MTYRKQLVRGYLSLVALMVASGMEQQCKEMNRKFRATQIFRKTKKKINNIMDGIAHDFNNLLQSISGHVSLLLRSGSVDEKEKRSPVSVKSAAELGASLSSRIPICRHLPKRFRSFLHKLIREVSELVTSSLVTNQKPVLNLNSDLILSFAIALCLSGIHEFLSKCQ